MAYGEGLAINARISTKLARHIAGTLYLLVMARRKIIAVIPARHICSAPKHAGSRWMLSLYFHRNNYNKIGLQPWCKTCIKIAKRNAAAPGR
jgi:hypothetical protein